MLDDTPTGEERVLRGAPHPHYGDVPWRRRLHVLSVGLLALIAAAALLLAPLPFSGQVALQVGDVARADVIAPRQVTYASVSQTQKLRDAAAAAVPDVYDPPQTRIARQQLTLADQILNFIGSVRSDNSLDSATRVGYVESTRGLDLPRAMAERLVAMPDATWQRVAAEVEAVLGQAMREEIRETNLADQRRRVPARVGFDLSDEDAGIVSQIVQNLMAPNSFYNASKTEERRQTARDRVEPVMGSVERNEIVLRAGDIVTPADLEALDALGLKQASANWLDVRTALAIMALLSLMFLYYLWLQEGPFWFNFTEPPLLATVMLLFVFFARIMVPAHAVLSYVFPYAALAMLLSVLIRWPVALVATALFALLVGWLTGSVELIAYTLFGGVAGALRLRRGERLSSYPWAAIFVVAANLLVVIAFRVAPGKIDGRGLAELATASLANGLVSVTVALLGTYLLGTLFSITTPLQLMEVARPTHPLLRQLLLKAPGTYHHTLIVSNMAERAAEAIGADALLARVGAYYHDVGKTARPYFFAENRSEGENPHDRLDPYTSAQIIIDHVRDGVALAHKYRLPGRVIDFIAEHHGTTRVCYFYYAAQQAAAQQAGVESVDPAPFTYPGPRPQSRETAITMLADCAEAAVRARHPDSAKELNRVVAECIEARLTAHELDECPLTLADLQIVQRAFIDVLRGIHHPRITYPTEVRAERAAPLDPLAERPTTLPTEPEPVLAPAVQEMETLDVAPAIYDAPRPA